jgi:hypothetical protein
MRKANRVKQQIVTMNQNSKQVTSMRTHRIVIVIDLQFSSYGFVASK